MILPKMFVYEKEIRMSKKIEGIYFIQSKNGGPIKIGKSNDVGNHLSGIQVGNPNKLKIIKIMKTTDEELEIRLHQKFEKYRLNGEWFSEEVLKELDDKDNLEIMDNNLKDVLNSKLRYLVI